MTQAQKDAISKSLKGRDITWADKISKFYVDNPDKGSENRHKSWDNTRHHCYRIIDPDGNEYTTTNLQVFCKEHGLSNTKMCQVATNKQRTHKGWLCKYIYRYDGKTKQRIYFE